MVAYEAYLLSRKIENEREQEHYSDLARSHFKRLLEGASEAHGFMLRDKEMKAFVDATEAILAQGLGDGPTNRAGVQNTFEHIFNLGGV
jgi:hypothetical protein